MVKSFEKSNPTQYVSHFSWPEASESKLRRPPPGTSPVMYTSIPSPPYNMAKPGRSPILRGRAFFFLVDTARTEHQGATRLPQHGRVDLLLVFALDDGCFTIFSPHTDERFLCVGDDARPNLAAFTRITTRKRLVDVKNVITSAWGSCNIRTILHALTF